MQQSRKNNISISVSKIKKNKFQIDTGADLTIDDALTWKKIMCLTQPNSKKNSKRCYRMKVKIYGLNFHKCFQWKRKLKAFVIRNSQNLFGTDWMKEFELFDVSINIFCNKIGFITISDKLEELKEKFAEIFSVGLGFCSKVKAKFQLKENVIPVFQRR